MIPTNSASAKATLNRIEIKSGVWVAYGGDGRLTTDYTVAGRVEGNGFRARFIDNLQGGDYGWGPLASNEAECIALLLAEYIGLSEV
jgi:hypothetical protein